LGWVTKNGPTTMSGPEAEPPQNGSIWEAFQHDNVAWPAILYKFLNVMHFSRSRRQVPKSAERSFRPVRPLNPPLLCNRRRCGVCVILAPLYKRLFLYLLTWNSWKTAIICIYARHRDSMNTVDLELISSKFWWITSPRPQLSNHTQNNLFTY